MLRQDKIGNTSLEKEIRRSQKVENCLISEKKEFICCRQALQEKWII